MQINCSGGKGVMELDACLACARKNPPCGYDYSLMKALLASRQDRSKEIHVTDLTGCLRRAWYSKTMQLPEYPHETLLRWMGTHFHSAAETENDQFFESEVPIEWNGLVGTIDVLYKDNSIKDFKFSRWLYPHKLPYGSHALQVNIYGFMLRKNGRKPKSLKIQYVDASGPTKCRACGIPTRMQEGVIRCPNCLKVFENGHLGAVLVDVPIMPADEIEWLVTERQEALSFGMEMNTPPEREPGYLCKYCQFTEFCQPELIEGD